MRIATAVAATVVTTLFGGANARAMPDAPPPVEPKTGVQRALAAFKNNPLGSFSMTLRPRYEFADQDGLENSDAVTMRAALGFGTRAYKGLSLFAEGEGVVSPKESLYFDGVSKPNGRIRVADPQDIELNQLYLDYRSPWAKSELRVGRQRMQLDDQRFIGNFGWRQNEMTMDAVRAVSGLGIPDFKLLYAYLHKARRPFGNRGGDATRDFESASHLIRLEYRRFAVARVKLFAVLLDFDNAQKLSSQTFGVRIEGRRDLTDRLEFTYVLSYAHQWDAAGNPQDYDTNYQLVRAGLTDETAGTVTIGFERLGSDAGRAGFSTPLATAHVFNGFADAFLDNGGPEGLRDLYLEWAPELPWRLEGVTAVHWFQSDQEDRQLGWEIDASLSRPITRWATLLVKAAYFDGRARFRPTRVRSWVQLTFFF